MTDKEKFNAIQSDMLKGTLQERLGYDLYDKILNHTYEGLPPASKEKFEAFLKKESNILVINLKENSIEIVAEKPPNKNGMCESCGKGPIINNGLCMQCLPF